MIPPTIDIKKYIIFEQNDYEFHGMILHSGISGRTGHCTSGHFSLLLHCGNGKWMFLDDQLKPNDVVELDEEHLGTISLSHHPVAMVYRRRFEVDTERQPSTNFVWRIVKRDQEIVSQQLFPFEIETRTAKRWWDINKVKLYMPFAIRLAHLIALSNSRKYGQYHLMKLCFGMIFD